MVRCFVFTMLNCIQCGVFVFVFVNFIINSIVFPYIILHFNLAMMIFQNCNCKKGKTASLNSHAVAGKEK